MKKIFNYIKNFFFPNKTKEEKIVRVKITKCQNTFSWYNKKVGEEFLVERIEGEKLFRTVESNIAGNNKGFIKYEEAEVLK